MPDDDEGFRVLRDAAAPLTTSGLFDGEELGLPPSGKPTIFTDGTPAKLPPAGTVPRPREVALRTTQQLRKLMVDLGVNPVELMIYGAAGYLPRFKPTTYVEDGKRYVRFALEVDAETGGVAVQEIDAAGRLFCARNASRFLFPTLKSTDLSDAALLSAGLDPRKPGDDAAKQPMTLLDLLRQHVGPGETVSVTRSSEDE